MVQGIAGLRPVPAWKFQPCRSKATTMRDQGGPSPTGGKMNYNRPHRFYCGVDLHARSMFAHVLDAKGQTVFEQDLPADPDAFLRAVKPYRKDLVVGCECMFAWYWLADLCEQEKIPFALGHALKMKHIHGDKAKSDKIDAGKLAALLRGGLFPLAYAYPRAKRQTRDLLRRRSFFVRQRSQLIAHIVNTNSQFNLPPLTKKLTYAANRSGEIAQRFTDPSTRLMVESDLALIDDYDRQVAKLELHLTRTAKVDDPVTFGFLRTVPGIGPILGLILLYEIDAISRFPEVGNFLSYARLVRCEHSSAGKVKGSGSKKVGNAHLKWAFSEAACLMIRAVPAVKSWVQRQENKRGKRKALSVLEARIGRAVYHLWRKQQAFDLKRFLKG
jgi:transposase